MIVLKTPDLLALQCSFDALEVTEEEAKKICRDIGALGAALHFHRQAELSARGGMGFEETVVGDRVNLYSDDTVVVRQSEFDPDARIIGSRNDEEERKVVREGLNGPLHPNMRV